MTKKEVVSVAKELNKVLGLDPQIDTKQNLETLKDLVLQAADLVEPGDELSKKASELIDKIREEASVLEPEEDEDESVDIEENDDGDPEDEDDDEPEDEDDDEPEDEDDDEDDEEAVEKEVKEKGKKEKKTTKSEKKGGVKKEASNTPTTRVFVIGKILKGTKNITIDNLIKKADDEYVKIGGKENLKESRTSVLKALHVLQGFDAIEFDGEKVSVKK